MLRTFMLFQHMRTEAASRRSVEMFSEMETSIGEGLPGFTPSIKEAVQIAMKVFADQMHLFDDLKVCLVRNKTKRAFVTSDDPAIVANRWHKEDPRVRDKSPGMMACGTTVFLPMSARVLCIAYDGDVYSVSHEKGWTEVRNDRDVEAFNEHQFLNAFGNVYFRDWSDCNWVLSAYLAVQHRRLGAKHRAHYAVLDQVHGDHKRYKVVERAASYALLRARGGDHPHGVTDAHAIALAQRASMESEWFRLRQWNTGGIHPSGPDAIQECGRLPQRAFWILSAASILPCGRSQTGPGLR